MRAGAWWGWGGVSAGQQLMAVRAYYIQPRGTKPRTGVTTPRASALCDARVPNTMSWVANLDLQNT